MTTFFILWKVLLLCTFVFATPTKRSPEEVIPVLKASLTAFTQDNCKKDPLLTQEVDGDESHYRPVVEDQILYTTKRDDSKEDVIILNQEEDKIKFKKMKRIYVGMKRFEATKKDDENLYHATFAFIR